MQKKKKIDYGWVVVAAGFLLLMVLIGVVNNCYSLYIIPITEELGFTRSQYTTCQSLVFLFTMISAAISWKFYNRFGIVHVMRVACSVLAVAYFCNSFAQSLPVFYLLASIVGFCMGISSTAPLALLLKDWFQENYGRAVGAAFMGSGIGGMVLNPLASSIITNQGWRSCFQLLGVIIAVVALPVVFFVLKEKPREQEPEIARNTVRAETEPLAEKREWGKSLLLMLVMLMFCIGCNALAFMITPYLQDIGHTAAFASLCMSIAMGVLAAGKLSLGILLDKWGVRKCTYICFGASMLGLLGLVLFPLTPLMLAAVLVGVFFSCAYGSVAPPMLAPYINIVRGRGAAVGLMTAVFNLGSAITPTLSGLVFDAAQSYVPLFVGSIAAILVFVPALKKLI